MAKQDDKAKKDSDSDKKDAQPLVLLQGAEEQDVLDEDTQRDEGAHDAEGDKRNHGPE